MVKALSILGVLVVLVLVGISAFMNYEFLSSWGTTQKSEYILGALSVCADIFKALLIFFIVWAIGNKRAIYVTVGAAMFAGLMLLSLASGMGFIASERDQLANTKTAQSSTLDDIKAKLTRERQKLQDQPKARAGGVIAQEINAVKLHRRWSSTKECTNATARKSKAFCTAYFKLQAESETTKSRAGIEAEIARLVAKKNKLVAKGGESKKAGDVQTSLIVKITGQNADLVQTSMNFGIALLLELLTAFGLYMATGHGGREGQKQKAVKAPAVTKRKPARRKEKTVPVLEPAQPQRLLVAANADEKEPPKQVELTPLAALLKQDLKIVATK